MRLFDLRMADGSRHFGSLPERYDVDDPQWDQLHALLVTFAEITGFATDQVTEAWLDFRYRGHGFGLNNQAGDWWCFVTDPACPDDILADVLLRLEALLLPSAALARARGPLAPGHFRTLVLEPDGRINHQDHADLAVAQRHAADARYEPDQPLAYVFDEHFEPQHAPR